jgi:1-phosphatidylinositol-4-phosphate 5-kinase
VCVCVCVCVYMYVLHAVLMICSPLFPNSNIGSATEAEKRQLAPVLKDLDFADQTLYLGDSHDAVVEQILADTALLQELDIMDYSMLVGIHYPDQQKTFSAYGYQDRYVKLGKPMNLLQEDQELLRVASAAPPKQDNADADSKRVDDSKSMWDATAFRQPDGGMIGHVPNAQAADDNKDNKKQQRALYYMGIIDILQEYNMKKKGEHFFKSFRFNADDISAVNSRKYGNRFIDFLSSHMS